VYSSFCFQFEFTLNGISRKIFWKENTESETKDARALQLEYRMKLFWRLGLAGFGGMSMIYHQIDEIDQDTYKPNIGMGLRFLVDKTENTNLRIDYAIGSQGQYGFYITFGESF